MAARSFVGVWVGPWVEVKSTEDARELNAKGCYGVKSATEDLSILSLQEALFLQHCLGWLDVHDTQGLHLHAKQCWELYCEQLGSRFPALFMAYVHLRSFGWVVRCGVSMGTDYLVYRSKGPDFYHSEYGIKVVPMDFNPGVSDTAAPLPLAESRPSAPQEQWASLQSALRLMKSVEKTVLFCFVIAPQSSPVVSKGSLDSLHDFRIAMSQVRSWLPGDKR